MRKRIFPPLAAPLLLLAALDSLACAQAAAPHSTSLRFEVSAAPGLLHGASEGRLFVVIGRRADPEPRLSVGNTGMDAPPVLARDVRNFAPGAVEVIDERAVVFPLERLALLPAGEYFVQALFDTNIDLKSINAPGNLYTAPQRVRLDPARGGVVRLQLTEKLPPEELPAETEHIKYVRLRSELLSRFHGRDIYLRAGVILPRDFAREVARRYPLRVHVGGYGERFTAVQDMMREGANFRRAWGSADASRQLILLHLDGDGPLGDPYQVNSDNHGPYGDAVTQELVPNVEQKFRGVGTPHTRFLDGGSTGGWVSLALQIFYPDFFNGAWSFCPDGVDFRAFQLIDIYADTNAYVNRYGFERPGSRDRRGDTRFSVRHEAQMENVLGRGDSWTMSGQQWGAWNATYGPRGADGRPKPLWHPRTGEIDRSVVEHWKRYDLRLVLEQNWPRLGPKLRGKLRVWMGDADSYFLNHGVYLLEDFISKADPPAEARITYGRREGHCWVPLSERELMDDMAAALVKSGGASR